VVGAPFYRQYFGPKMAAGDVDQRGCGQYPHAELRENTTEDLRDIEKLEHI